LALAVPTRYRDHLLRVEARWLFEPAPDHIETDRAPISPDLPLTFASFEAIPCPP
jgi:hypothetical protein